MGPVTLVAASDWPKRLMARNKGHNISVHGCHTCGDTSRVNWEDP